MQINELNAALFKYQNIFSIGKYNHTIKYITYCNIFSNGTVWVAIMTEVRKSTHYPPIYYDTSTKPSLPGYRISTNAIVQYALRYSKHWHRSFSA